MVALATHPRSTYFGVYNILLPVNTHATDSYPSATSITGCTAAGYNAANITEDSRTPPPHASCLSNYEHDRHPLCAAVQPAPVIVYNPNSNPLFHSHPYADQILYDTELRTSAHAPLNPGYAYAAP